MTSWLLSLRNARQERHFDVKFTLFHSSSKFNLLLRSFTFCDLASSFWKVDGKSVILINNLPAFNQLRNLTLNEPKFLIASRTQIFRLEIIFKFRWSFWVIFSWKLLKSLVKETNLNQTSSVKTENWKFLTTFTVSIDRLRMLIEVAEKFLGKKVLKQGLEAVFVIWRKKILCKEISQFYKRSFSREWPL